MILGRLTDQELQREADLRSYPKWWTLCLFRLLEMPTLNACLIPPESPAFKAHEMLLEFADAINRDEVLVRSDGGKEHRKYPRGGVTYRLKEAIAAADSFLELGRAVILLEPTNRLSNKLSVNILVDQDLDWIAEVLSCGFDTSDLQRDFVTPEWSYTGNLYAMAGKSKIKSSATSNALKQVAHAERVNQRLLSIADLYKFGHDADSALHDARSFLVKTNNLCLFDEERKEPDQKYLLNIVFNAKKIAKFLSKEELPFTLSFACLADERCVYWDIAMGNKWG